MAACEVCGSDRWEPVGKRWERCLSCGHLDAVKIERTCEICGASIGKFAKDSMTKCVSCNTLSDRYISTHCSTPFCGRKIRPNASRQTCHECLDETTHWKAPNGPQWKEDAARVFRSPRTIKAAYGRLKALWPQLTRDKLVGWVTRQKQVGFLVKIGRGTYAVKDNENVG